MLYLAIAIIVLATLCYIIASKKANAAALEARRERNAIYRNCFLNGLAGMLARMTAVDGSVDSAEAAVAKKLFAEMGLSDEDRALCDTSFDTAAAGNLPGSYYASLFSPYSSRESRLLVYEVLWDIAAADGQLHAAEETFLKELLSWLELDPVQYDYNLKNHADKFGAGEAAIRAAGAKLSGAVA